MKKILLPFLLVCLLLGACNDNIAENERFVPIEQEKADRHVLLVDFTGQKCPNCPYAAKAIEEFLQTQKEDDVVAVAVHGGLMGLNLPLTHKFQLVTDYGKALLNSINKDATNGGLPAISVNLHAAQNAQGWQEQVLQELKVASPVAIALSLQQVDDKLTAECKVKVMEALEEAHLHLWVLEDNVVAPQLKKDGMDKDYKHQHVFRASATPLEGKSLNITKKSKEEKESFEVEINPNWNLKNVRVIAFVTDKDGHAVDVVSTDLKSGE